MREDEEEGKQWQVTTTLNLQRMRQRLGKMGGAVFESDATMQSRVYRAQAGIQEYRRQMWAG